MLWVPRLNDLHSYPGYLPNGSSTSVCCGFLGWMTYILTLVCAQCFQHQCMLWVPGLDVLHSDPSICPMVPVPVYVVVSWAELPIFWPRYLPNVSRTSVCCGILGWMTYILTLVSAQCFQDQCMLWVPWLDGLHSDPGNRPMFPGPVNVLDSWAGCPTFWPWYLPNVSRTSVCYGFLSWMAYILTLVSTQCFQDQCMLWIPGLDVLHSDPDICPMFPWPVYVMGS